MTRDLARKSYPVTNFMACGFAGSVQIGFSMIESLKAELRIPDHLQHNHAGHPGQAADHWAPMARRIFASHNQRERSNGCHLLLVGASPTEECGLGSRIYFVRMVAPDFRPQYMVRAIKLGGIGTGAKVRRYTRSVKPLTRMTSGLMQAEVAREFGWGIDLGHSISRTIGEFPVTGISRHLHITIVTSSGMQEHVLEQRDHAKDGSVTVHAMPTVAESYADFCAMCRSGGLGAAGAIC